MLKFRVPNALIYILLSSLFTGNCLAINIDFKNSSFIVDRNHEVSYGQESIEDNILSDMSTKQLLTLLKHRLQHQQQLSHLLNQEKTAKHIYASLAATHLSISSFYNSLNSISPLKESPWLVTKEKLFDMTLDAHEHIVIDEYSFSTFQTSSKIYSLAESHTKYLKSLFVENTSKSLGQYERLGLKTLVNYGPTMWGDFYELFVFQELELDENGFNQLITDEIPKLSKDNFILSSLKELLVLPSQKNQGNLQRLLVDAANLGIPSNRDGLPLKSIGIYLVPNRMTRNNLMMRYENNKFWNKWGGPHVTFSGFAPSLPENKAVLSQFFKQLLEENLELEIPAQTLYSLGHEVSPYTCGGDHGLSIKKIFDYHFKKLEALGWERNKRSWHLTLGKKSFIDSFNTDLEDDKDLVSHATWSAVLVGGYELTPEIYRYHWGKEVPISLKP